MERKLDELGVTESERRLGVSPRRAALLLGLASGDSARRLLRENGVTRKARGYYDAVETVELRQRRIEEGLIHADAGLPLATVA